MNSWLNLDDRIPGISGSLIHVLSINENELKITLESLLFEIYEIDGVKIVDERSFFTEFSRGLQFPSYFGKNWAAWDDALGDFEDLVPQRAALIWKDAHITFTQDPQTFVQAVCDLYNFAASVSLETDSGRIKDRKQFEVFLLVPPVLRGIRPHPGK